MLSFFPLFMDSESVITHALDLLEVPPKEQPHFRTRIMYWLLEDPTDSFSILYQRIIKLLELRETPFFERFALRLDDSFPNSSRSFHDVVSTPEDFGISLEEALGADDVYLTQARALLAVDTLDVLIDSTLASPEEISRRIAALDSYKERCYGFLIPPGRPLKKVRFTEDGRVTFTFGKRPVSSFETLCHLFDTHYAGRVPLEFLERFDSSVHRAQRARQILHSRGLRFVPRPKHVDPVDHYYCNYSGVSRSELLDIDPSTYRLLRMRGFIHIVPIKREFSPSPQEILARQQALLVEYATRFFGKTRSWLSTQSPGFYQRLRQAGVLFYLPTQDAKRYPCHSYYALVPTYLSHLSSIRQDVDSFAAALNV